LTCIIHQWFLLTYVSHLKSWYLMTFIALCVVYNVAQITQFNSHYRCSYLFYYFFYNAHHQFSLSFLTGSSRRFVGVATLVNKLALILCLESVYLIWRAENFVVKSIKIYMRNLHIDKNLQE